MPIPRGSGVNASSLFLAAALLGATVLLVGGWFWLGAVHTREVLATGKRTTALVVSREIHVKRKVPFVEIRLEEFPDVKPMRREIRRSDWNALQVGDRLPYTCLTDDPGGGVLDLEIGMRTTVGIWFVAGGILVAPLVLAGAALAWRDRWKKAPA